MQDMLFLSQRIPYPPNKGDKIRSFNILKHFSKDFRIHLGCFIDDPADWEHLPKLKEYCVDSCVVPLNKVLSRARSFSAFLSNAPLNLPYFHSPLLREWTVKTLSKNKPQVAFAFSSQMAQYFLDTAPRPPRIIVDYCDVDSDKWIQYSKSRSWPMSWVFRREGKLLLNYDRQVGEFIDAGTFVSEPEVALFDELAPESKGKFFAIGNGIDTEYFTPENIYASPFDNGGPVLIFTGAMDYWPNVDAVSWFSREIFPRIREIVSDARFFIVGSAPSADVRRLAQQEGVFVTGRVPDMRPYFAHAHVAVTPMRIARGIQNKVLEAMAMQKPTITTSKALAGIDATHGKNILVADDNNEFLKQTLYGLQDPSAAKIGSNAREFVSRNYSWSAQLSGFDSLLE